jgi:hypothetical protein
MPENNNNILIHVENKMPSTQKMECNIYIEKLFPNDSA